MRSFTTLAAASAAILPLVVAEPGTISMNFEKRKTQASRSSLARRDTSKTVNTAISNEEILYLINTTVGTPPQPIGLQLDTGSSDIWFPASSAPVCQSDNPGCIVGSYNQSASSTYSNPGYGQFDIQYVDGTSIQGQYISDVFSVGGINVTNQTMAQAFQTSDNFYGIMGVGFPADESSNEGVNAFTYQNIIDTLVNEKKINTRSYSLWLDDLDSDTGSIMFGGVDKNKYTGDLIAVPIQKDSSSGNYTSFTVAWTGLTINSAGQTYNENPSSATGAILDSGTSLLLLPDSIATNIFNGFGVITDANYGYIVPCSLANDSASFTFEFGGSSGPKINVSISEFVLPTETSSGRIPKFRSGQYKGQDICTFGIEPAGNDPVLFGDTFLRSAYVVYDLDNLEIGLAQTNFNSNTDEDDVRAFTSSGGMPDAATTVTSVVVSATGSAPDGPITQSTATATGDVDGDQTRTPTFSLSTASSSASHSNVAGPVPIPSIQRSTIIAVGTTLAAFLFGTLML